MKNRRGGRGLAAALALCAAVAALWVAAPPAGAAVDHEAAIIELPWSGFAVAPAGMSYTGPVDENGDPVQPGWESPSYYKGGHMKSWASMATGEVVAIIVGEFTTVMQATLEKNAFADGAFEDFPTVQRSALDVPEIPGAVGVTGVIPDAGLTVHLVGFNKGAIAYGVVMAGPAPDAGALLDLASQQHAAGPSAEGNEALYVVIGLVVIVGGIVVVLGVIGLVIFLIVRKNRKPQRLAGPPPGWSMQPPAPPYQPQPQYQPQYQPQPQRTGSAIRWGADVDAFESDSRWAHPDST